MMRGAEIGAMNSQWEALKWIAIVTMVIDHVGYIFFPQILVFRLIGRIAFPLFCLLIAVRLVEKPQRWAGYLKRLSLWAVVSHLPYWVVFSDGVPLAESYKMLNIMATLGLGVLVAQAVEVLRDACQRRRVPVSAPSAGGEAGCVCCSASKRAIAGSAGCSCSYHSRVTLPSHQAQLIG